MLCLLKKSGSKNLIWKLKNPYPLCLLTGRRRGVKSWRTRPVINPGLNLSMVPYEMIFWNHAGITTQRIGIRMQNKWIASTFSKITFSWSSLLFPHDRNKIRKEKEKHPFWRNNILKCLSGVYFLTLKVDATPGSVFHVLMMLFDQ